MLAHLPNRFNSLTRGRVRATSTPAENHYNGAKLFVFARFAFARSRVCTSPVSRDASRSFSVVVTNYGYVYERNYARACIRACVYVQRSPAFPKRVGGWLVSVWNDGKRRCCSPFSVRSFYHAEVAEASEHDVDDDGVTSCQRRRCCNGVEYRVHGIEIENYTVCWHECVASSPIRAPLCIPMYVKRMFVFELYEPVYDAMEIFRSDESILSDVASSTCRTTVSTRSSLCLGYSRRYSLSSFRLTCTLHISYSRYHK